MPHRTIPLYAPDTRRLSFLTLTHARLHTHHPQATIVSRTAVTTTLAACSGALSNLLLNYGRHRVWDLLSTCIGALAGERECRLGCWRGRAWAGKGDNVPRRAVPNVLWSDD